MIPRDLEILIKIPPLEEIIKNLWKFPSNSNFFILIIFYLNFLQIPKIPK